MCAFVTCGVVLSSWALLLRCAALQSTRLADSSSIRLLAAMAASLSCSAFGECLNQVAECAAMTAALVSHWRISYVLQVLGLADQLGP